MRWVRRTELKRRGGEGVPRTADDGLLIGVIDLSDGVKLSKGDADSQRLAELWDFGITGNETLTAGRVGREGSTDI